MSLFLLLFLNFLFWYYLTPALPVLPIFPFHSIPLPAKVNRTDKELTELGECIYDQGGYFVINGSEKVSTFTSACVRIRIIARKNGTFEDGRGKMYVLSELKAVSSVSHQGYINNRSTALKGLLWFNGLLLF